MTELQNCIVFLDEKLQKSLSGAITDKSKTHLSLKTENGKVKRLPYDLVKGVICHGFTNTEEAEFVAKNTDANDVYFCCDLQTGEITSNITSIEVVYCPSQKFMLVKGKIKNKENL